MNLLLFIILTLFFLINPLYGEITSKIYEDIKRDFEPLSALIIGLEGNEVILDKGRAQGVRPRDIFTVYKKVKKIVHPETKESLGFLKEPIGKVEVIRIEENFSIARILSKKEDFPIPAHAKKNADLKILIVSDGIVPDEGLFITLKNLLPESGVLFDPYLKFSQLTPQDLHAQKIDLVFAVGPRYIKVYNAYLDLIRAYGSPFTPQTQAFKEPINIPPPLERSFTLEFKQKTLFGKMPGEVLQAEITDLDGDGTPDLIYITPQELMAVQIKGGLLGKYKPEKGEIISLSVGPAGWVALNVYEKNLGLRSEILKYTNGVFQPVIRNLNLILQFVDYSGSGQKDTLLAQTFDPENFFGKEVYIVKREGNSLRYAKKIEVPQGFRLIGSNFVELDGDQKRELVTFLEDGRLAIYKDTQLVYSTPFPSAKHFYFKTLTIGKPGQESTKAVVYPVISPIIGDFNGDGIPDLLFVKAEFPLEKVAKDLKSLPLNQGHFQFFLLSYQGTYYFRALNLEENGVLSGLGLFGKNLFYLVTKGVYPGKTETELYSILY
ncbi:MAG: hypothetical protein C0197_05795 [Caldimicrobium thiodismutans]|uniref:VCBS repeat-containing protein n=1 Tax=Caldimicrobium thiodismutans TaxID=1653476 RepID=A0A2N7PII1_9BACT|nr:MAG: hypothetical protein C0197_05795 [Caldimicrobium thiodismutans]